MQSVAKRAWQQVIKNVASSKFTFILEKVLKHANIITPPLITSGEIYFLGSIDPYFTPLSKVLWHHNYKIENIPPPPSLSLAATCMTTGNRASEGDTQWSYWQYALHID